MSYLNESAEVTKLRNAFCEMIRHGGCPSMCKMKAWAELKNAVVREAYSKAGVPAPAQALEPFGFRSARELIAELKGAYKKWDNGVITQEQFVSEAHRIEHDFEALAEHGHVADADEERFHDEYTSSMMAATDVPEL